MNHQDWNVLVINKSKQTESNKSHNNNNTNKKPETMDVFDKKKKSKVISIKLSKYISQKRLTEPNKENGDKYIICHSVKDLASKINCNVIDVKKCETPNSPYNPQVLNKIKRYLNININTFNEN